MCVDVVMYKGLVICLVVRVELHAPIDLPSSIDWIGGRGNRGVEKTS
jgi:hypothetical protein